MFNIIEQQVKLNMKTETKEERTPKVKDEIDGIEWMES